MLDFISKDVQKYMAENGLTFTDFEKAALIYNSDLAVNEKHTRLEALAESTADETLKEQIAERLRVDREDMDAFFNNTGDFIYKADVYDPEDDKPDTIGYFRTAGLAYEHAKKKGFKFAIEKYRIIDADTPPYKSKGYTNPFLFPDMSEEELVTEYDWSYCACGDLQYNKYGELTYFWSREVERDDKEKQRLIFDDHRFENAFVAVPNPFEKGDIVSSLHNGAHGIINTSRAENEEYTEKVKSGKIGYADFFDSGITVDFVTESDGLSHNHISPAFLEKYEPREGDEDYDLLTTASAVYMGECTLDWLMRCYDDYKEKHGKK